MNPLDHIQPALATAHSNLQAGQLQGALTRPDLANPQQFQLLLAQQLATVTLAGGADEEDESGIGMSAMTQLLPAVLSLTLSQQLALNPTPSTAQPPDERQVEVRGEAGGVGVSSEPITRAGGVRAAID